MNDAARELIEMRPVGGFDVILADPPWRFASNSESKPGRNAIRHYRCMKVGEIEALPVKAIAAPDALCLMWVTVPFAERAFRVLRAWGFAYGSQLVWPKTRIGTGYYARNRHELLYIGRRGRFPVELPAMFPDSIIPGEQREHSRKPGWVHEQIERRFPETRRLEMFARAQRPGWAAFGNEIDKFTPDVETSDA